jgi:hypothetical protein
LDPVIDLIGASRNRIPLHRPNNFFIYWEGSVLPEFSEEYRIRIKADGGVRLWVNGQIVIDDFESAKFRALPERNGKSGSRNTRGRPHSILRQHRRGFDAIAVVEPESTPGGDTASPPLSPRRNDNSLDVIFFAPSPRSVERR